jgi:hypothetical protein
MILHDQLLYGRLVVQPPTTVQTDTLLLLLLHCLLL